MLTLAQLKRVHLQGVSMRAMLAVMARWEHRVSDERFHRWLTVELRAMDQAEAKAQLPPRRSARAA